MTTTGKIMLCINLTLGLSFMFWSISLYTEQTDRDAIAKARKAEADRLKGIEAIKDVQLRSAVQAFNAVELQRPALRQFYAKQLDELRRGTTPPKAVVMKSGVIQLAADGKPALGDVLRADGKTAVEGLKSISLLNSDLATMATQTQAVAENVKKAMAKEQSLNVLIGNGKDNGLLAQLAFQKLETQRSEAQHEFLRPIMYNRQVEAQLLVSRQLALTKRLNELKGSVTARQP
jgi:hypothetical protein